MAINFSKSCCIRVGSRIDKYCANISSKTGIDIPWVTEIRYLRVYRAANSIFGKIGRSASDEVILQLISSKCIPILLYGIEVIPTQKYQLNSLDFVVNRFFMKLFKTINIRIIQLCQELFHFELPSVQLARCRKVFSNKFCV